MSAAENAARAAADVHTSGAGNEVPPFKSSGTKELNSTTSNARRADTPNRVYEGMAGAGIASKVLAESASLWVRRALSSDPPRGSPSGPDEGLGEARMCSLIWLQVFSTASHVLVY